MISNFRGQYTWLSNFHENPVIYEDMTFPSVEAAYQAAKTTDRLKRLSFCGHIRPNQAKAMGRQMELRPDWEEVKEQVMLDCLRNKFAAGTPLAQLLINTGEEILIEGNTWHDNIWGDCTCERCVDQPGRNLLGKLLMQIRDELNAANSK